jgi:hypothetical protein
LSIAGSVRTRARGATAKATGVAQTLRDLRGGREGVRADRSETRGFEKRRRKKEMYLAVLMLELMELAVDVLDRLLYHDGHHRRPSGGGRVWVWLRTDWQPRDDGYVVGAGGSKEAVVALDLRTGRRG